MNIYHDEKGRFTFKYGYKQVNFKPNRKVEKNVSQTVYKDIHNMTRKMIKDASTRSPRSPLTDDEEFGLIKKLSELNVQDLNNPKGVRNIIGSDTSINQIDDAELERLINIAKIWKKKNPNIKAIENRILF